MKLALRMSISSTATLRDWAAVMIIFSSPRMVVWRSPIVGIDYYSPQSSSTAGASISVTFPSAILSTTKKLWHSLQASRSDSTVFSGSVIFASQVGQVDCSDIGFPFCSNYLNVLWCGAVVKIFRYFVGLG